MFGFNKGLNIVSDSKARGIIDYIIARGSVRLPDLMDIRVNGERLASVSTHISDGRAYAKKLGYRIVNTSRHGKKSCESSYRAELLN